MIVYHLTKTKNVQNIIDEGFYPDELLRDTGIYFAEDVVDCVSVSMMHCGCQDPKGNWSIMILDLDDRLARVKDEHGMVDHSFYVPATTVHPYHFNVLSVVEYFPIMFPDGWGKCSMIELRNKMRDKLYDCNKFNKELFIEKIREWQ